MIVGLEFRDGWQNVQAKLWDRSTNGWWWVKTRSQAGTWIFAVAMMLAVNIAQSAAGSLSMTAGDILVTLNQTLFEYTPTGTLVGSVAVPPAESPTGSLRSPIVDNSGRVQLYNGTFTPYLTTYNPADGTYTFANCYGLSTLNITYYGGIAAYDRYVYLTDMATSLAPDQGIVRFDTTRASLPVRFAPRPFTQVGSTGCIADSVGWDGLLYVVSYDGNGIFDVYDPITMVEVKKVSTDYSFDFRGIAADRNGQIFTYSSSGIVAEYSPNGNLVKKVQLSRPADSGTSVSLTPDGKLLLVSPDGLINIGDESLSNFTSFTVPGATVQMFGTWIQAPPAPEPSSIAGLVGCLAALKRHSRQRGR